MVVALIAVRMVEMTVDQIIHMITVRYRFMSAIRTMFMLRVVSIAIHFTRTVWKPLPTRVSIVCCVPRASFGSPLLTTN